ncbi:MAG: carboxymuconolactone decarboxylase family protein [Gemmatimonadetes bacterium]|nr:carboxymuconolactone decarboxylase family protein [Gemmatimonadota bacterium]
MTYPVHTIETAPGAAKEVLAAAQKARGFVPNLYAVMADAPALLKAYLRVGELFDETSFSPTERQIVLLTVSYENSCEYCMAAHSAIAGMQKVPGDVVQAIREGTPITDPKLQALHSFTRSVVASPGRPTDAQAASFLRAGYSRSQILEVVLGVAMKTLSNYTNHLADTPLDDAFAKQRWSKTG